MLRRYTWETAKEKLQHYRRRTPEASVLYQIVHHSRDDLQFQWEYRFQHQYGCLRDEVLKTLDEYLNCGILAHGAARVYCDGCKYSLLIAFSCKRRGVCPSCGAPFSGTGQLSISLTHPHNKRKPHRKMSRSRVALYQWSYQWSSFTQHPNRTLQISLKPD